jgi:hypothetical protein
LIFLIELKYPFVLKEFYNFVNKNLALLNRLV